VGRHTSTLLHIFDLWSMEHPERAVAVIGVPRYAEVIEKGIGYFLRDPSKAEFNQLLYE
jgi:hypothetical protein